MADLLPDWETHRLNDGTLVTVRPIHPSDKEALLRAFAALGVRSRMQRFLMPKARLDEASLQYLTNVDGVNHVALVAITDSLDFKHDIGLGVARFVRLPEEKDTAEAAVTVVDEAQGKGIGKILLAALTREARKRGIRHFRGEALKSNTPIQHILSEAGAIIKTTDNNTIVFDVPIGESEENNGSILSQTLKVIVQWLKDFAGPA